MKIQKASEMDSQPSAYNFVLIGYSGSGKSHALMTFPKNWQVLVLDMFGNKETYAGDPNIEVISFSDLNPEAATAWPQIQQVKRELIEMIKQDKFQWNAIVIDTMTGLTRFIENYVLMTNPESRGIGGSAARQHYRGISHVVGQFITGFLGFPITNVIVCHVSPPYEEGQVANKALIVGTTWRNAIYTYVHEVYHSFAQALPEEEGTQYVWQTQPSLEWPMLKSVLSRGGTKFGKYVEPNFSKLLYRRGLIEEDQIKEPKL
jgi:hypothetical protein